MLRTQAAPTTLAALAQASGLHENTVREHLDALVAFGLATRQKAPPLGRGRPAWLYEAAGFEPHPSSEYAGLATALAESIHRNSATPIEDAIAAGRSWGLELVGEREAVPQRSAAAARRKVVELFDDLGFAPESDVRASSVRLTRCPLLEAAHRYPDVVCSVHLGITQVALEEYGAAPVGARLLPFSEPGACRLHLVERKR